MTGFQKGTRANPMMSGVVANLTIAQIEAIAAYFAALPLPRTPEPTPLPAGPGAVLAIDGDWNHSTAGIPACNSCHGPYGLGVGSAVPRLAGQPSTYVVAQLGAWQKDGRKDDPRQGLMKRVADKLTAAPDQCGCGLLRGAVAEPAGVAKTRCHGVGPMSHFLRAVVPLFAALSAFVAPASVALAQETAPKADPVHAAT